MGFKIKFKSNKGNIGFTSDDIDDFEIAKQKVCNLLDQDKNISKLINEKTWIEIFSILGNYL